MQVNNSRCMIMYPIFTVTNTISLGMQIFQLRADRYATVGGIAGATFTTATGAGLVPGLLAGVAVGTITSGIEGAVKAK